MMTQQNPSALKAWQQPLGWLLLIVWVGGVEYLLGWGNVLAVWDKVNPTTLVVAFVLLLLAYALAAWRLYDYFPQALQGKGLATWRLLSVHVLRRQFFPTHAGEGGFPAAMKHEFGVTHADSISALLWFRFLDIHAALAFLIYPLLVVTPLRRLAIPVIAVWVVLPLLVYLLRNVIEARFAGRDGYFSQLVQQTLYGLPDNWSEFWRSWLMTWASWMVKLLTLAWLLGQFLPDVTWNMRLTAVVLGELASALPLFVPLSAGLYEGGIIAGLLPVSSLQPIAIAAINVHLFVLVVMLVGGLLATLLGKLRG
ncbi:lysylphosphatidylglycerol synthase domain-containing protein [Candidatus Thiothrix anitrata]|uniref:Flippase-like domain-containing protein n=1 Tax=Candidatus Thiothrix anitrata TaxID=2823902 RepID=A0ABX7X801_9GAMM|nr:lysylphosphatidylglycerol synthase domain-containing protein [Candidatus Thiothrix anitrata]QTR50040.1 flippase-like domain-containing protein [Candidatus Thiothrix anitrata]